MWTDYFESMLALAVMAALLRASYEMSQPEPSAEVFLPQTTAQKEPDLTPWQKGASERAMKRYAEAQPKKWRNWNEAMFERMV